ncbi:MAG: hypothetical protein HUJ13_10840 [Hydrogenovibrio crunogenus]|nr:hypothetical protein [Hydrogenovibrio crunogenus]
MSFFEAEIISVGTVESKERINNLRVVKGLSLEISDSVPNTKEIGRDDYFKGVSYQLTLSQAKEMADKLSRQIEILESLSERKSIVLKEDR